MAGISMSLYDLIGYGPEADLMGGAPPLPVARPLPVPQTPDDEAELVRMGILPPTQSDILAAAGPQPSPFAPSRYERFLEAFSAGLPDELPQPHGFGEGLIEGLTRGFGNAGRRVAAAREEYRTGQRAYQMRLDAARAKANEEYRGARQKGLSEIEGERRKASIKPGEQRIALTPDEKKKAPSLARTADSSGTVSKDDYLKFFGPPLPGAAGLPDQDAAFWLGLMRSGVPVPMGRGGISSPAGAAIAAQGIREGRATGAEPGQAGSNVGVNRAEFRAAAGALTTAESDYTRQSAFVSTLKKNTDMLRQAAKKVADLGPRFVNAPIRSALGQLGSADQARYEAALLPVQTESGRLLSSGPALGGSLTVEAQRNLNAILSGSFNGKQLSAVLDLLEKDADNRLSSYDEQRKRLRQQLRGQEQSVVAPGTTSASGKVVRDANGRLVRIR